MAIESSQKGPHQGKSTEIATEKTSENIAAAHRKIMVIGDGEANERRDRGLLGDVMIEIEEKRRGVEVGR